MGQCMSRKAAGAIAASAAVSHSRPTKMQKHQKLTSPEDDTSPTAPLKPHHAMNDTNKRASSNIHTSKGVAMSFGFKRRGAPSIASNASAARRLAEVDGNGNGGGDDAVAASAAAETDALTESVAATGRSTPRLAPPKKEANATRLNRFGFRQTQSNRQNKIADLNYPTVGEFGAQNNPNNNAVVKKPTATFTSKNLTATGNDNNNRNRMKIGTQQAQIGKYTLQSTQLPRPESVRLIETKTAKTLANNNRRYQYQHIEETSSKDGSLTEDSGVGSNRSGFMGEVEQLDASPNFGARRRHSQQKARNLEMVATSKNTFDVRELGSNDSCDSLPPAPLPQLPSAFRSLSATDHKSMFPSGLVHQRTIEYQRHLNRGRKISATSSEGFSDDYGEEEKTYRETFRNEKIFTKAVPSHQSFLKSRNDSKEDSSPPSSEHEWTHGGEAMADEISFSLSSSDESKDKLQEDSTATMIGTAFQSLIQKTFPSEELKNITLTIEDQKFAAISSQSGFLLDEETLISPIDSISCSETEEIKKKFQCGPRSDSKEINEKLTPSTPGTPTNASNSLSLSDGKDDFLIDDEIADQPALVFEDGVKNDNNVSQNSELTPTLVDSTPKLKRKGLNGLEGSPMSLRNRKFLHSRTGSLDTLSPCESLTSDDLMMDYEYSQSSGLEECDKQSSGYPSINDPKSDLSENSKTPKDWNVLVGNYVNSEKSPKGHASRPRLLRSRAGSQDSRDSPRSLESRSTTTASTRISQPSLNGSPAKSRLQNHRHYHLASSSPVGYDSDDSIRLDRQNHTAIKQDIMSIKTMLLKLKRVMNESETHNPFESQAVLTNGLFNGLAGQASSNDSERRIDDDCDEEDNDVLELAELRRQVLFLQGQLEDKEKTVRTLQEQMVKLAEQNYHANSAPASTVSQEEDENNCKSCNAATQTERCD